MCALAQLFAELVSSDDRFELVVPVHLGLVCFRLKVLTESTECWQTDTCSGGDGAVDVLHPFRDLFDSDECRRYSLCMECNRTNRQ